MIKLKVDKTVNAGEIVEFHDAFDAQMYLGCSTQTINKYRKEGWLQPAGQVGNAYLYTTTSLDEASRNLGIDRKEINTVTTYA